MTETKSAAPEGELDPNLDDAAEGEEVVIDALTGEVRTLTAAEIAAEEAADRAEAASTPAPWVDASTPKK
jgi:hypothetical protein